MMKNRNLTLCFTSLLPRLPHFLSLSTINIIFFFFFPLSTSCIFPSHQHNSIYVPMADNTNLPPGFRFYPSDEDLVVHFLHRRTTLLPYHPNIIPDLDLLPYDPWDLEGKALSEGRKWYYYSRRTPTRVSESGFWKPLGGDEPIYSSSTGRKVGSKRYFMFYIGDDPSSSEGASWTNWIMHEYRLSDASSSTSTSSSRKSRSRNSSDYSRWVICKVYEQSEDEDDDDNDNDGTELSCLDEVFLSMDDYDEISLPS